MMQEWGWPVVMLTNILREVMDIGVPAEPPVDQEVMETMAILLTEQPGQEQQLQVLWYQITGCLHQVCQARWDSMAPAVAGEVVPEVVMMGTTTPDPAVEVEEQVVHGPYLPEREDKVEVVLSVYF